MRKAILSLSIVGLLGCAPNLVTIRQFHDVDDMILLTPRMKKNSVLQYIGTPKEIRAGLVLKSNDVAEIWLYSIREKLKKVSPEEALKKPTKTFKADLYGNEKEYALYFVNDELVKWGYLKDVWSQFSKEDGEIIAPVSSPGDEESTPKAGILNILRKE